MKLIDFDEVKELKSHFRNLQKRTRKEAINFLVDKYFKGGFAFHRLFLHSGIINAFELSELNEMLSRLDKVLESHNKIKEDLYFLQYLLSRKKRL